MVFSPQICYPYSVVSSFGKVVSVLRKELMEIPQRMRELREILEISAFEMANKLQISLDTYQNYENGNADIPLSTLYEVANILNVDFTVLMTGDAPRMRSYFITRAGSAPEIARFGYSSFGLAHGFIGKDIQPLLVKLTPTDLPQAPVTHSGQEFNYVLSGKMAIVINGQEHILSEGDCIYFDPALPHGQHAVDGPASFLTIIKE